MPTSVRVLIESGALAGGLGIHIVDQLNPQQRVVAFALFWRANLAPDTVAGAQPKATNLRLRDVHVIGPRQQARATQKAEAIGDDVKHAVVEAVACLFRLSL